MEGKTRPSSWGMRSLPMTSFLVVRTIENSSFELARFCKYPKTHHQPKHKIHITSSKVFWSARLLWIYSVTTKVTLCLSVMSLPIVSENVIKYPTFCSSFFFFFHSQVDWYWWKIQGWNPNLDYRFPARQPREARELKLPSWQQEACASCALSPVDGAVFFAGNGV